MKRTTQQTRKKKPTAKPKRQSSSTARNVSMREAVFRLATGVVRFRPHGKVTCHDNRRTAAEAKRTRYGAGGFSARIFVGLSVGEESTFSVDDIVKAVAKIRKQQGATADASILSQRGIYEDRANRLIIEDSVQIVIIDLGGLDKQSFAEQMLELGEDLREEFEQEKVIVEIQRRGVTTDVWELAEDEDEKPRKAAEEEE